MTKDEFMDSKPIELMSYGIAYKLNQKRRDEELWLQGLYNMHGFSVVLSNMFNKNSKAKYFEQPLSFDKHTKEKELTEEELQKQRELFVAKLMAMQKNFELNHKSDGVS